MTSPRRISFTGPESTGKTTLARHLARRLDTFWTPEYARYYLRHLSRPYEQEDLIPIVRGQLHWEENMATFAKSWLFCDTDPLVVKVWSLYGYGACATEIARLVETHRYAHYFVCDIDLPWTEDHLREHPDIEDRRRLLSMYIFELEKLQAPYTLLSGPMEKRVEEVLKVLKYIRY